MLRILVLFFIFSTKVLAFEVWYEDNNLASSTGMPSDFKEKFYHLDSFKQASKYIDVYMLRVHFLKSISDEFLFHIFHTYLKKNNIKLAIDVEGATFAQLKGRTHMIGYEMGQLKRLKELGIEVSYISFQSVLSRNPRAVVGNYSNNRRVQDIIRYSKFLQKIYPKVEFGLIDALFSKGREYKGPFFLLKSTMEKEGLKLSYIHLDITYEIPKVKHLGISWHKIKEVEDYVENKLGLRFGYLFTTRKGGYISNKEFHKGVIGALDCYVGSKIGTPSDLIITSWFPYPTKTVPETAIDDDYPVMRTVLEFGGRLDYIEAGYFVDLNSLAWSSLCRAQ